MARYAIDLDQTSCRMTFRPGMPGLGGRINFSEGEFEMTLDDEDRIDLDEPFEASFVMNIDDIRVGGRFLSRAVRSWLGGDDEVPATGQITDVRARADSADYEMSMVLVMKGDENAVPGRGSLERIDDEHLRLTGQAKARARTIGVPVPSLVPLEVVIDLDMYLRLS